MPRVTRGPRHSVKDRPGRLKLLLRRQRKLLRPLAWVGFATLIILLGVTILHSATPGGTLATLRERFGSVTALAGLRITDVVIEGRANTPEPLLRAALGVSIGDPILGFSVEMARQRMGTLSWVEHATVERRLPGTVVVFLQERRPFAIWQNQAKFVLIDAAARVQARMSEFRSCLWWTRRAGCHCADRCADRSAGIQRRGRSGACRRRWDLASNGADVLLPEGTRSPRSTPVAAFHRGTSSRSARWPRSTRGRAIAPERPRADQKEPP
jgi:cell division protein FtsQ